MHYQEIVEAKYPKTPTQEVLSKAGSVGFDTSKLWYHGTRKRFDSFRLPKVRGIDELGPGVYLTSIKWLANTWSKKGGFILTCLVRKGPLFDLDHIKRPETKEILKTGYIAAQKKRWGDGIVDFNDSVDHIFDRLDAPMIKFCLAGAGYIGAYKYDSQIAGQIVVFDPEDVRIVAREGGKDYMYESDAYHNPVVSDPVLSGDVVKNIFHTGNRGYCINASTMKVYSFDTFEHAGHVRFKNVSPDPFLRDYPYYGSHTMMIRHHIVAVSAYNSQLTIDGQGDDILKTKSLWLPAVKDADAVFIQVCDKDGVRQQHANFSLPFQRHDLNRFINDLAQHK